jgi:hypothetical protein
MAVERADRRKHQRPLREIARVVHDVAGGEIVGPVGDDVVGANDVDGVLGHEAGGVEARLDMRVQVLDRLGRAPRLELADALSVVDDLALEIVDADAVVVDDADRADAGSGEIEQQRRTEAASADDQHARGFELLLAFATDLLEHQVALVAQDLVRGEHGLNLGSLR